MAIASAAGPGAAGRRQWSVASQACGPRKCAACVLSRVGADRADQLRTDVEAATAGWADAALLRVDSRNQVLVAGGRVVLGAAAALADKPPPDAVFLGRIEGGRHVWAIRGALQAPEDPDVQAEVVNLRSLGPIFDDTSSQLVSSAIALLNWHDSARFSAVDGSPTRPARGGLVAGQPGHRSRGVPAHRPGGDLSRP